MIQINNIPIPKEFAVKANFINHFPYGGDLEISLHNRAKVKLSVSLGYFENSVFKIKCKNPRITNISVLPEQKDKVFQKLESLITGIIENA